jgi:hypothetical protein
MLITADSTAHCMWDDSRITLNFTHSMLLDLYTLFVILWVKWLSIIFKFVHFYATVDMDITSSYNVILRLNGNDISI